MAADSPHASAGRIRHGHIRNRWWLAFGIVVVIAAGLASRRFPSLFPAVFGSHTGDALWALMVYLGCALIKPRVSGAKLAASALFFSVLVEASQLYRAEWINAIRATTPGHLVLGIGFQWMDLVAYTVGIGLGFLGDYLISKRA